PLRLGLRHALHAVTARLVPELLKNAVAGDAEDDFLESPRLARAELDSFDRPPLRPRVAGVHVVQVAREQGGLTPAGPGTDFDDQAVEVLGRIDQQRFFDASFQLV